MGSWGIPGSFGSSSWEWGKSWGCSCILTHRETSPADPPVACLCPPPSALQKSATSTLCLLTASSLASQLFLLLPSVQPVPGPVCAPQNNLYVSHGSE